jgi:hypothetical protein
MDWVVALMCGKEGVSGCNDLRENLRTFDKLAGHNVLLDTPQSVAVNADGRVFVALAGRVASVALRTMAPLARLALVPRPYARAACATCPARRAAPARSSSQMRGTTRCA